MTQEGNQKTAVSLATITEELKAIRKDVAEVKALAQRTDAAIRGNTHPGLNAKVASAENWMKRHDRGGEKLSGRWWAVIIVAITAVGTWLYGLLKGK